MFLEYVDAVDMSRKCVDISLFCRHVFKMCRWYKHMRIMCRKFNIISTYYYNKLKIRDVAGGINGGIFKFIKNKYIKNQIIILRVK